MLHLILFLFFGAICVAGAVNLLVQSHPINSALSLIVVMASLAAEYLAARRGVCGGGAGDCLRRRDHGVVLITIMLLNAGKEERSKGSRVATLLGVPGVTIGGAARRLDAAGRSSTTHSVSSAHCGAIRKALPGFFSTTFCCLLKSRRC
jgi:hypothetical protein